MSRPPGRGCRSEPTTSEVEGRVDTNFRSARASSNGLRDRGDLVTDQSDAPWLPEIFRPSEAFVDEARRHRIVKPIKKPVAFARS
jgi:hypothetical protein